VVKTDGTRSIDGRLERRAVGPSWELRGYVEVLRTRRWWFLGIVLLTAGSALAFSLRQTPVYESVTEVLVKPVRAGTADAEVEPDIATEQRLARSTSVAEIVADSMGFGRSPRALLAGLTVEATLDADILTFRYADAVPERAQGLSQGFADAYLTFRQREAESDLAASSEGLRARLAELDRQLDVSVERFLNTNDPIQQDIYAEEIDSLRREVPDVQRELAEMAPETIAVGRVVDPADRPTAPISPDHIRNAGIGIAVGLILGLAVAFLRERLDVRLRGKDDLEAIIGSSVLAAIPHVRDWRKPQHSMLVTRTDPGSAAAEAYRSLRTSMLFAASSRSVRTWLITSAHAGEGKTATTANLGVVLAQAGKRVVLVSADLRQPRLHEFFGETAQGTVRWGLTDVLAGQVSLEDAVAKTEIGNLRILPSGSIPGNPADLLGSEAMRSVLQDLAQLADLVLIDAAPVLPVTDAVALAPLTDGVLFVTDTTSATHNSIAEARQHLQRVNARVIGVVMNKTDDQRPGYRYGYGQTDAYVAAPSRGVD
jgi:capsular exopolysaccharide synthesis family protein